MEGTLLNSHTDDIVTCISVCKYFGAPGQIKYLISFVTPQNIGTNSNSGKCKGQYLVIHPLENITACEYLFYPAKSLLVLVARIFFPLFLAH